MKWTPRRLKLGLSLYPPYLFAGVSISHVDENWRELNVAMKLRWFNRNAMGTHFGGSLYSMVDPHYMLLMMQILGPDYIVWDQAATIYFKKPGRGRVHAVVRITDEVVADVRRETADGAPYRPEFELEILDESGDVVAIVNKTLYVRKKQSGP